MPNYFLINLSCLKEFLIGVPEWHERLNAMAYYNASFGGLLIVFGACILGFAAMPVVMRLLFALKLGQKISPDAPDFHSSKAGTPTMGGLGIIFAAVAAYLLLFGYRYFGHSFNAWENVCPLLCYALANALIGAADDWLTVFPKRGIRGIKSTPKALLQLAVGICFVWWSVGVNGAPAFFMGSRVMQIVYVAVMSLLATAFVNFVNITDGLDGLAGGMAAVICLVLGLSLKSPWLLCICGACLAFLYHNSNPAKVFMGDTGSLFLGSALIGYGIITHHELIVFTAALVFVLDGFSTVIQWAWFKYTRIARGEGRRLFLKAPVHHHYEMKGIPEQKIVARACIITFLCCMAAVLSGIGSVMF